MVASAHAHSSSAQSVWKDGRIEEWKFVYNGSMEWPFSASVFLRIALEREQLRRCGFLRCMQRALHFRKIRVEFLRQMVPFPYVLMLNCV